MSSGKSLEESKATAEEIVECSKCESRQCVEIVGCDDTDATNERISKVIRHLQELLQKTLQCLVCMVHANELPCDTCFCI